MFEFFCFYNYFPPKGSISGFSTKASSTAQVLLLGAALQYHPSAAQVTVRAGAEK